jgi:hypothetical protein
MAGPETLGQSVGRLTDDLQMMNDPDLLSLIFSESLKVTARVPLDLFDGLENV